MPQGVAILSNQRGRTNSQRLEFAFVDLGVFGE